MSNEKRVMFFSIGDLAGSANLQQAEIVLDELQETSVNLEINDALELFNIRKYFENNLFLNSWNQERRKNLANKSANSWSRVVATINAITTDNFLKIFGDVEFRYRNSFWNLFNSLKLYKKIDRNDFQSVLNQFPNEIHTILQYEALGQQYSDEIRSHLLIYEKSAELLVTPHMANNVDDPKLFFPKTLTGQDKEEIILKYLESDKVNLNFLRLIEHTRDSELKLNPKVRLKVRNKSKDLNNEIITSSNASPFGVAVGLDPNQEEPLKTQIDGLSGTFTYGKKYLDKQNGVKQLLGAMVQTLEFTDTERLINFVNRDSDSNVLESVMVSSKNEYGSSIIFQYKSAISHLQTIFFDKYLQGRDYSIERLISDAIRNYFAEFDTALCMRFRFASTNSSFVEKIRNYAPELEQLLKQFNLYVEDKQIDFDLLEISSSPLNFSDVKSLIEKKYVYSNHDLIKSLGFFFFSYQSPILHIEANSSKFDSFFQLVIHQKVQLKDFYGFQEGTVKGLISDGFLKLDGDGVIHITDPDFIFVVGQLHQKNVLNYWRYPENIKRAVDEMQKNGLLFFESKLLTHDEVDCFNFHLNKKSFTNGLDIRNKYLHGVNSDSEIQHQNEFFILLKLIILTILKIEDELIIRAYINRLNAS